MHELAITEGLVKIALDTAQHHNAKKVSEMHIAMGELSTYVPECVQEYFAMLAEDTPAEECRLVFRTVEARCRCTACGKEFRPAHLSFACPDCGSYKTDILEGKELFVENLEIET